MNINCSISVKESDRTGATKIKISIEVKIESFYESNGMATPLFRGSKPVRAKSSGTISGDEIPVTAAMEESGLRTFLSEERVANLGASLASIYREMERARREGEMPPR